MPDREIKICRTSQWVVFAICTMIFLLNVWPRESWVIDDALIYQNYIRNLVRFNIFAYNLDQQTEGFSSPLWLLLLAAIGKLGFIGFHTTKLTGTLIGIYILGMISFAGDPKTRFIPRLISGSILAMHPSFALWCASGIDTPMIALCVALIMTGAVSSNRSLVTIGAAFAAISRPEGPMFTLVAITWMIDQFRKNKLSGKNLVAMIGLSTLPFLGWQLVRFFSFGTLIANSAYSKLWTHPNVFEYMPFSLGVRYLLDSLPFFAVIWLFALPIALVIKNRWHESAIWNGTWIASGLVFVTVGFNLAVKGDWMPWWRFILPIVPALLIWIMTMWSCASDGLQRVLFGSVSVVALLLSIGYQYRDFRVAPDKDNPNTGIFNDWRPGRIPFVTPFEVEETAHVFLNAILKYTEPGDTVVHFDIGHSGYLAHDIRVLDQFGLVSRFESEYLHGLHSGEEARKRFLELSPSLIFTLCHPESGDYAFRAIMPMADVIPEKYTLVATHRWWMNLNMIILVRNDAIDREPDIERLKSWNLEAPGMRTIDRWVTEPSE